MLQQPPEATIRKAKAGDSLAFRDIVEQYQGFVFAVAHRFLGNTYDAEDVTQETFVRLWKNISNYKTENKLSTWLYRIVANLCLDHLKSAHNQHQKKRVDLREAERLHDSSSPEKEMHNQELSQAINEAAASLTPKQKAVFILRDIESLPVEEVCAILSMSSGTVKSNLYYARQKMADQLKILYPMNEKGHEKKL